MADTWSVTRTVIVKDRKGNQMPVKVDMTFDLMSIARVMGHKAARNKSGKSKLAMGVVAEVKIDG